MIPWGLPWGVLISAVILGVVGSARATRLITSDSWPPIMWLKGRWDTWSQRSDRRQAWWVLPYCPWCTAPYVVLANGAWAVLSDLHWSWWMVNGWAAVSYWASWIVFKDED